MSIDTIGKSLGIVLVQCEAIDCVTLEDVETNVKGLLDWLERASEAYPEAEIVVFPECSIQGAHSEAKSDIYIDIPGDITDRLSKKSKEYALWAVYNFLEKSPVEDFPYNTTIIIDDKGKIVLKHRKVNPFVPLEKAIPGNEINICKGPKGAVFGIMTCYDGDFPEVARELSFKGANVMLRPSCYMEPYSRQWGFINQARAYENLTYLIAVNRVGTSQMFTWFGGSMAVDFNGNIIIQAPFGNVWMTKVNVYPLLVNEIRKDYKACNHLYNLKHRGYVGVPPQGDQKNIYSVYRDWD